ncbi:hypothetical protein [Nocardioides coralli]|uniref:hypothetical protein n=1 Tax=Nocardioides coralli TaxID=2872154 RepID=UPI001CA3E0E2|nr:hypothetical protein [Nocardioides coralli]QZY29965.1 hypothetical protein K6T13_04570 [Nocardioides coralli]
MRAATTAASVLVVLGLTAVSAPAVADHTDPQTPLAPTEGVVVSGIERGEGTWEHLANFPGVANPALTGGGTDLEFFTPAGSSDIWGAFGTLGQDVAGSVGQRFIQLTDGGKVEPTWRADHGSAHCAPASTSVTGLQHDTQIAERGKVTLVTDTTDATGRCHDPKGGGIEIIDASDPEKPREVHLVRFPGYSHTNTLDQRRPWIVYSSASDFSGRNWIDVMDMRSCFGKAKWSTDKRRSECRPRISRIQLEDHWTQQRDQDTGKLEPGSATCHDITYARKRLYCAALNATVILDVSGLTDRKGRVRGQALDCEVVEGTGTGAQVTDCSGKGLESTEHASGWKMLGFYQHPGRDCAPGSDTRTCNTNIFAHSDDAVAVSHEADPTPDERFMFVTDERGGGIVPPGASCSPGIDNPFGNGGAHALDISDPRNIDYATTPTGDKAVYISDAVVPAETFCDIHVIEQVPGEQRLIAAYYSQGIKIVDYYVDREGNLQFEERASFTLPNTNTWAAEDFKITRNPDGTRTYYLATNDIHRGIDVVSWTGKPNPMGSKAPKSSDRVTNAGLAGVSALTLAAAALYRRRRAGQS